MPTKGKTILQHSDEILSMWGCSEECGNEAAPGLPPLVRITN